MKHSQESHSGDSYHNMTVVLFTLLCVLTCGPLALSPKAQTKTSDEQQGVTPKTLPGRNGKIAFTSTRDGNDEIYTMEADGSNVQRLTNNPEYDTSPKWSPDGTRIVFQSTRDNNYEIYVMNADGTNQTRLTSNRVSDGSPEWSPDGTRIVFTSIRDGNYQIYVMNADGSNQTRLTNNPGRDGSPKWSPDGTRIVFERFRSVVEIHVMNADGSNQTQLTNSGHALSPRWSPDSSRIAFQSYRDGNPEIYVMNADGSNQTRLTNNPGTDGSPRWSPDGTRIVFQSFRSGYNRDIYVMNADGTNQTRLTNNPEDDHGSPIFSPDGTRIAFHSGYSFGEELIFAQIYVMNADGSNPVRLTNPALNTVDAELDWQALPQAAANSIDTVDFFVRQQYRDFLSREADAPGLAFWQGQMESYLAPCGTSNTAEAVTCRARAKAAVSEAFFVSVEFQETGYLVYRLYKSAYPESPARPRGLPRFAEFLADAQTIGSGVVVNSPGWEAKLEANKVAFIRAFVQRGEFIARFPETMTGEQYVNALLTTAGLPLSGAERDAALQAYGAGGVDGRAAALRSVAESDLLFRKEFNKAFVLMQYFGYLRRNPDGGQDAGSFAGYDFWLKKLNDASGDTTRLTTIDQLLQPTKRAQMVEAFVVTGEYRRRFGIE